MPGRGPIRPFTPRQDEIAELIRRGWSYAQIGAKLKISPHTVASHVKMMAVLFDLGEADGELGHALPPRMVILVYATYRYLERGPTPGEKRSA